MHWFWRATIAMAMGIISMLSLFFVLPYLMGRYSFVRFILVVLILAGPLIITIAVYGLLTRYYHPKKRYLDGETRCRKCGYILRGIPEPRCSECGERI